MATLTVAEAKNRFSDVLRRAEYGGERVIVARHGKPVAAIVSNTSRSETSRPHPRLATTPDGPLTARMFASTMSATKR